MSSSGGHTGTVDDARQRAIEFGRRLREVREKRSESLRKVERRSGLNSGYLSQLENGKITHPSPSILQRLRQAMSCGSRICSGGRATYQARRTR